MRLFAITLVITCGLAAVLFGIALALLLPFIEMADALRGAATVGGLPMLAFPKVTEFVEQQQGKKNLATGKRTPIYDFRGFQIAWPLMVVVGTLVLWSVGQLVGGTATAILIEAAGHMPKASQIAIFSGAASILGAYFVGRWIGTRCSRRGVVTMLLAAFFAAIASVAMDVALLSDEQYRTAFDAERLALPELLSRIAVITLLFLVPGLLGYWRGRKHRLSKYLHYLLGVLPAETRDTVVELAFDEAQKIASAT